MYVLVKNYQDTIDTITMLCRVTNNSDTVAYITIIYCMYSISMHRWRRRSHIIFRHLDAIACHGD